MNTATHSPLSISAPSRSADALVPPVDARLIARYDVAGPRYTSYPTVPAWTTEFGPEAYAQTLREAGEHEPTEPLSLYTHIPFCQAMCLYCGCNVIISRNRERAEPYLAALDTEMELVSGLLGERRRVSQLHWGGGTPTFLDEDQLRRLWSSITRRFELTPDAEVSVETNPATTSLEQLALLRELGFNRLSIGVQDLDPQVQAAVNRVQPLERIREFIEYARGLGFQSVNFDLIYGLPHQTPRSWARTLDEVLAMRPDRAAVYGLAYVPELRPHQRKMPEQAIPRGREKLDLFRQATRAFVSAGYETIGMDHFAAPGDELAVARREGRLWRNFQGYTVQSATETVAFGVTAIGDIGGGYAQNVRSLARYYEHLGAGRLATERGCRLDAEDRERRRMITQLMCNLELDLGPDAESRFAYELEALGPAVADGLAEVEGSVVRVTPLGRFFLRNVAMPFDTYLRDGAGGHFSRTV